jgi:hypothetical protein
MVLIVGAFLVLSRGESPTVTSFVAPMAVVEAGIAPVLKVTFGPQDAIGVISVESVGDGARPCGAGPLKAGSVNVECAPIESTTTYRFTATVGKRVVSKLFTVSVKPTIKTFSATTPVNAGEATTFDVEFGPRGATGTISQSSDPRAQPCGAAPIAGGASARIACAAIESETAYVLNTKLGNITETKSFVVSVMPVINAFSAPKPAMPGTRPLFTVGFSPAGARGVISTSTDEGARPCGEGPIAADASTVTCDPIRSTTTYLLTVQLGSNTATRKFVLPVMEPNLKCLKPGHAARPAASSGNALLVIAMTSSWGMVSIDGGKNLGETPCVVQIAAGTHAVRVTPPSGHAINRTVTVAQGESRTLTFAR